jgi:hypothetical protein
MFLCTNLVLPSVGLALSGAGGSTKLYAFLSALTYRFLYSSIMMFFRTDSAEDWFRYVMYGMNLLLPVAFLAFTVSDVVLDSL